MSTAQGSNIKEYMVWAGNATLFLKNTDLTEHNQVKYFQIEIKQVSRSCIKALLVMSILDDHFVSCVGEVTG
jgi:hypothetical protein